MNYLNILPFSTSDFEGVSVVLAVSGCVHKCAGCWGKSRGAWKYTSGFPFDEDSYQDLKGMLDKPYIKNLVIQGGDGLAPKNLQETITLCERVKKELPSKRIVVFTGYTFAQIKASDTLCKILPYIDVIIDGKYDKTLQPAQFRGSSNQQIIDVKKSLANGDVVLYDLSQ